MAGGKTDKRMRERMWVRMAGGKTDKRMWERMRERMAGGKTDKRMRERMWERMAGGKTDKRMWERMWVRMAGGETDKRMWERMWVRMAGGETDKRMRERMWERMAGGKTDKRMRERMAGGKTDKRMWERMAGGKTDKRMWERMWERMVGDKTDKRMTNYQTLTTKQRICVVPKVHGVGGMVSFLQKFSKAVENHGVEVTNDLSDLPYAAVLVIGGTRDVLPLYRVKQRGVRLVQRLDGINWIHRRRPVSLKHFLRAEYGNFILSLIRRFLADRIVYQSEFSRGWWNDWFGRLETPFSVVHNGVDLDVYRPVGQLFDLSTYRLLVVEGSLGGGYENGLENAVRLAEATTKRVNKPLEVIVVGEVGEALKAGWTAKSAVPIRWAGLVAQNEIPRMMNDSHALFSADVHPACPNSVIEALACGLPVVAYDTGSLAELVPPEAGVVVPYGGDSWNLEPPVVAPLAQGLAQVLENQDKFRAGARARAESAFSVQVMMERYLEALLG